MTNWTDIQGAQRSSERQEFSAGPADPNLRVSVTLVLCPGEGWCARPGDVGVCGLGAPTCLGSDLRPSRVADCRTIGHCVSHGERVDVELVMHNDPQFGPFLVLARWCRCRSSSGQSLRRSPDSTVSSPPSHKPCSVSPQASAVQSRSSSPTTARRARPSASSRLALGGPRSWRRISRPSDRRTPSRSCRWL